MKPTWEREGIQLYLGDALDVLSSLPEKSADSLITDPPYCSGAATEAARGSATHQGLRSETIKSGRFSWFDSDNMTTAGLCWLMRSVCVAAPIEDSGSILAFCDWRMLTMLAPSMESAGWRLRNVVVWNKGHFGCGTGFRPQHEMIIHLTKRSPAFYAMNVGNVISVSREEDKEHPTEKPVELMAKLISVACREASIDPFMGGGTTGVACVQAGKRFIGIERSRKYFDIAVSRIESELERAPLFKEPSQTQVEMFE